MKATELQIDVLKLILRSPDRGNGWRSCAPVLFEKLIKDMPDELVEKDADGLRARLTDDGEALAEWML
jgi:hypothetical protein